MKNFIIQENEWVKNICKDTERPNILKNNIKRSSFLGKNKELILIEKGVDFRDSFLTNYKDFFTKEFIQKIKEYK